MKLLLDPFDTEIFKKNIYKLYLEKEKNGEILESIKKIETGIVFCFTVFSVENCSLLTEVGFKLISIRNTYKLDLNSYLKKSLGSFPEKYKILSKKKGIKFLQKKDITQLAAPIYKTSRYSRDKLLEKNKSRAIYTAWVSNSLFGSYANEAFLVFYQASALGMITLKIKDGIGFIDLLGIIKQYQNKGLATYLLKKAVDYFKTQNINDILVTTEGENIPANNFYQKNNFILQNVELVYHKHI